MPKIKVIQIAIAVSNDSMGGIEERSEYLDDKGRVWYPNGHWEYPDKTRTAGGSRENRKWVEEWKQIDLPDDPEGCTA